MYSHKKKNKYCKRKPCTYTMTSKTDITNPKTKVCTMLEIISKTTFLIS